MTDFILVPRSHLDAVRRMNAVRELRASPAFEELTRKNGWIPENLLQHWPVGV